MLSKYLITITFHVYNYKGQVEQAIIQRSIVAMNVHTEDNLMDALKKATDEMIQKVRENIAAAKNVFPVSQSVMKL